MACHQFTTIKAMYSHMPIHLSPCRFELLGEFFALALRSFALHRNHLRNTVTRMMHQMEHM